MILHVLRALFILLMGAVGWYYLSGPPSQLLLNYTGLGNFSWLAMALTLAIAVLLISVDILASRRKLAVFSGVLFGLVVGVAIAYAISFVVKLLVDQYQPPGNLKGDELNQFF